MNDPDLVETNGYYAFVSAIWFYMTPQSPKPSMHEAATRIYQPNSYDQKRGLGANFGSTIMIINGGLECTTSNKQENAGAAKRESHYSNFLEYFGLPAETGKTCATI